MLRLQKQRDKPEKKQTAPTTKAEKTEKPTATKKAGTPKKKETKEAPKTGGSLTDFLPLVQVALDLLGDFRRKLLFCAVC